MLTANEKLAMINLDLVGRVQPTPTTGRLLVGDLLQRVGKMRQFTLGNQEISIPPPPVFVPGDGDYPIHLRRRRR